jgi:hypothetical protein
VALASRVNLARFLCNRAGNGFFIYMKMTTIYLIFSLLILGKIVSAATGYFDGSGSWVTTTIISATGINWDSAGNIVPSANINWNDAVETVQANDINWTSFDREIQKGAINWASLDDNIGSDAINWTDIDTNTGKAACWNGTALSHCTSAVDASGNCTCQ